MNILVIIIILFLVLESLNIVLLYFAPESTKGNSLGYFEAFEKSKKDPDVHLLVLYLINWVAGTKLIFIMLLVVILCFGDSKTIFYSTVALIGTISVFYWRLYPLIRKIDDDGNITPKGYSKTLGIMIGVFILVFLVGAAFYYQKVY